MDNGEKKNPFSDAFSGIPNPSLTLHKPILGTTISLQEEEANFYSSSVSRGRASPTPASFKTSFSSISLNI